MENTITSFKLKLKHVLTCFVGHSVNFFSSLKLCDLILFDLQCNTLEKQVSKYLNPMENSVFQFSFSNNQLNKCVLLV